MHHILNLPTHQKQLIASTLLQHLTPQRQSLFTSRSQARTRYLTLVLEDIYQNHNAAAVLRTADCFGIQDLHVIENRNKLKFHKTTVARGADKWLSIHSYNTLQPSPSNPHPNSIPALASLKSKGYKIAALALSNENHSLESLPLDSPLALVLGTEESGISPTTASLADYFVKIPMLGFTQSLNLSVCAGISLYALRQRLHASSLPWLLHLDDQLNLQLQWLFNHIPYALSLLKNLLPPNSST